MKTTNFWADDYPRPDALAGGELPASVDVAVVGSGYTGLNAALALAKAGVQVVVLEGETIGWGASSRNGSFASPYLKPGWKTIEKRYGLEMARHFWTWCFESQAYLTQVIEEEGIVCDCKRTGMLGVAVKPSHAAEFREGVEYLEKTFGYTGARYVEAEELGTEIGSHIFFGGEIFEDCYRVHPAKYVFGLAEATARRGAILVEEAQVTRVQRSGNSYTLQTSKGKLRAEKILLATNGYTTNLLRKARNGILPVGSYMIATEPLSPELQAEICPTGRLFWDSKIYLNYFGLTPDGRAFIGGRANLSPHLDLANTGRGLHARLLEIFPQLAEVQVTHSWSGRLGVSFDQMPHIGRQEGIYYAYGYSGQGVSTAGYMGKEVGELIAGTRQSSAFMEIKHPTTFLAPLEHIYLPFVSAWFKFLDWAS